MVAVCLQSGSTRYLPHLGNFCCWQGSEKRSSENDNASEGTAIPVPIAPITTKALSARGTLRRPSNCSLEDL